MKRRHKVVIRGMVLSLLLVPFATAKPAKADTPILGFAAGVAAGVVGNWIYGKFGGNGNKTCVTVSTTISMLTGKQ